MKGRAAKQAADGPSRARQSALSSAATCRTAWSIFAQRNAERAGVADAMEFRGGDALQRMPPMRASPA
jgi:putative N6-adenine-specific DNA methylase